MADEYRNEDVGCALARLEENWPGVRFYDVSPPHPEWIRIRATWNFREEMRVEHPDEIERAGNYLAELLCLDIFHVATHSVAVELSRDKEARRG